MTHKDTFFNGNGKVYEEQRLLSACSYRFFFRQHVIDTGTDPHRYIAGITEIVRGARVICEKECPIGTTLILHLDEYLRLPFAFINSDGEIVQRGDVFRE
jgi:hypothetical protein